MKRHELWRHRYRMRRDLDHLSEDELSERLHDCVNNLRTRTERGKLGLLMPNEPVGGKWMELFTEVLEECNLRAYSFPGPIALDRFRESMDHAFDPIPDMDQALSKLRLGRKPYLLKFGDPHWLQQGWEYGTFRVASASFYGSDDHNHARRDTELERFIRTNPRFGDGAVASSSGTWNSVSSATDYYLFSLSEQYSSRLFGDFAATACLIIFDPRSFLTRLRRAVSQQLPGWQVQTSRVQYYDPVRIDPRKIVVPTYKPFRHWYQSELRLVSSPPEPITNLPALNISIGPLNDCAMLVDLSSHPPPILPADPRD